MLCLHLWYRRVALNDPTLWLCVCTRRVRRCCRRTPACRVLISSQTSSPRTAWWRSSRLWPKTPRWWSLRSITRLVRGDLMFLYLSCHIPEKGLDHFWTSCGLPLLPRAEAEVGRLGRDGDRLHVGEQLQHPQIRLPLHPAGSPCQSRHGHHAKQRHEWETLGKSLHPRRIMELSACHVVSYVFWSHLSSRRSSPAEIKMKTRLSKQKKNHFSLRTDCHQQARASFLRCDASEPKPSQKPSRVVVHGATHLTPMSPNISFHFSQPAFYFL